MTYWMLLPAEPAVSGYAFQIAGRTLTGRVDRKCATREQFEHAIASGGYPPQGGGYPPR